MKPKFELDIKPSAWQELKRLPGNVRQRIRRAISDLAVNPYPSQSIQLNYKSSNGELRRLRIGNWRIVYSVIDDDYQIVAILGIRRRPPYDYSDLENLSTL
ncbi:MAG: type II toxin-antitoxin system RelE/ParE family toxin [Chloroflexota bacterium]